MFRFVSRSLFVVASLGIGLGACQPRTYSESGAASRTGENGGLQKTWNAETDVPEFPRGIIDELISKIDRNDNFCKISLTAKNDSIALSSADGNSTEFFGPGYKISVRKDDGRGQPNETTLAFPWYLSKDYAEKEFPVASNRSEVIDREMLKLITVTERNGTTLALNAQVQANDYANLKFEVVSATERTLAVDVNNRSVGTVCGSKLTKSLNNPIPNLLKKIRFDGAGLGNCPIKASFSGNYFDLKGADGKSLRLDITKDRFELHFRNRAILARFDAADSSGSAYFVVDAKNNVRALNSAIGDCGNASEAKSENWPFL
jgi:hypothetical protein